MRKTIFLLLLSLLTFFAKAQRNDHLSTNVDKLTPEIIDAWKLVFDARPTDCYRRDFPLLQNLTAFKKTTVLWNWIGGESGMKIILQKNVNAPCPPCVSCEQPKYPYLNRMSEYIADVGHLYRYQDKPGINVVLNALKGLTRNGLENDTDENAKWSLEGATFMIRCVRENFTSTGQLFAITEFEKYLPKLPTMQKSRYTDIAMGTKLVECKSWFIGGSNFTQFTQGQGNSYGQFLDYLQNIGNNINNLEYWFDKRKASESDIKLKWQLLFKLKAEVIFNSNPTLFRNARIPDYQTLKLYAEQGTLVNHSLFNFIKGK